MSCPGTPEAGYSTIDPKLLRVLLEAQPKSEERRTHDSRMKELFEAAIKQAEDDIQVRHCMAWHISFVSTAGKPSFNSGRRNTEKKTTCKVFSDGKRFGERLMDVSNH